MTAFEQRHLDSIERKKIGPDLTAVITTEAYQSSLLNQNVNVVVYYYEGGGLERKLGSRLTDSGTRLCTTSESRDRDEGDRPDDGIDPAYRLGWGDAKPEEVGGATEKEPAIATIRVPIHPMSQDRGGVGKRWRPSRDRSAFNHLEERTA